MYLLIRKRAGLRYPRQKDGGQVLRPSWGQIGGYYTRFWAGSKGKFVRGSWFGRCWVPAFAGTGGYFNIVLSKSQQKKAKNAPFMVMLPVGRGLLPIAEVAQNSAERSALTELIN